MNKELNARYSPPNPSAWRGFSDQIDAQQGIGNHENIETLQIFDATSKST